jgi:hypothetical protein
LGAAIGQAEKARQLILGLGAKRFGPPTAGIAEAVRAIADVARLDRMADRLFDAADWADLLADPPPA